MEAQQTTTEKLPRKAYEKELLRLQTELVKMAGTPPFTVKLGNEQDEALSFEDLRHTVIAIASKGIGLQRFKVYGDDAIPAGEHQVRMEFTYDGGGLGKGGDVALFLDGEQVGSGRVDGTVPMLFSADETTDVGSDSATPVSDDYGSKDSEFTGKVRWVQLDADAAAEDADHLITPEERLRVAMARQ